MLFTELLGQELSWCGMLWGQDDLGTQAVWTRFNGCCFFLRASYMLMGCKTPMVWKSGLFLPCSLEPPLCKPITSPNIDEANSARCSTRENGQLTVAVQPGRPPLKQLEINPPPRPIRHQTVIPRTRQHIHDKRIRLSNGLRTTLGLKHDQNLWFSSSQIVALNLHNCTSPQCRSKLLVVSPSIKRYHRWLIDGPQMDHRFHPCSSYFLYTNNIQPYFLAELSTMSAWSIWGFLFQDPTI